MTELKIARMRCNLTQKEVAKRTGIHPTVISNIEGRRLVANQRYRGAILEVIGGAEADFFDESTGLAR